MKAERCKIIASLNMNDHEGLEIQINEFLNSHAEKCIGVSTIYRDKWEDYVATIIYIPK